MPLREESSQNLNHAGFNEAEASLPRMPGYYATDVTDFYTLQ